MRLSDLQCVPRDEVGGPPTDIWFVDWKCESSSLFNWLAALLVDGFFAAGPCGAGDERASGSRHARARLPPVQAVWMAPQERPAAPKPGQRPPVQQVPLRRSVGISWHNPPS